MNCSITSSRMTMRLVQRLAAVLDGQILEEVDQRRDQWVILGLVSAIPLLRVEAPQHVRGLDDQDRVMPATVPRRWSPCWSMPGPGGTVDAERAFLARIEAGCQTPLGAWAKPGFRHDRVVRTAVLR